MVIFFYKLEIHSRKNKNKKLVGQEHNPIKKKKKTPYIT